eukprot:gene42211-52336_t
MIPADIRRFIIQCIPSVPYLEAWLLLREGGQREWDGAQLARRLYMDTPRAEELLAQLARAGLLEPEPSDPPRYRYAPRTPQLAALADQLAQQSRLLEPQRGKLVVVGGSERGLAVADQINLSHRAYSV